MKKYKNVNGKSGVSAYESDATSIKVQFHDGGVYLYCVKAGIRNVENMKKLAEQGSGLNAYINTNVKLLYDSKS